MKTRQCVWISCVALAMCLTALAQEPPGASGVMGADPPPDTNALTAATAEAQRLIAQPDAGAMRTFVKATNAAARLAAAERSRQAALAARQNAREEIELLAEGGAIARFGPHQVTFPASVPGVIAIRTPDGQILQNRVVGLWYLSDTGRSVLLAGIKESAGELVDAKTVIYRDAFDGAAADLVYEYTRTSFEQLVLIRKQLPEPEAFGFAAGENVHLAVLSEFLNPPEPRRVSSLISLRDAYQALGLQSDESLMDETLSWGAMRMAAGRSFTLGEPDRSVPSGKTWQVLLDPDGKPKYWLLESTPYRLIKPQLDALPIQETMLERGSPQQLETALLQLKVPTTRTNPAALMARAKTAVDAKPGVVLDYLIVNTAMLNVEFVNTGKNGPAAFGYDATDYWNPYDCTDCLEGSLEGLSWSDWNPSPVGLVVSNAPGVGYNPLCGPVDSMYAYFILPTNGGHLTVTITNLPDDEYDFVVYATRASEAGAPTIELKRDGSTIWSKLTTLWGNAWYSTAWEEHEQFVRFRNITVTNQTILLDIWPDAAGYASLSGLQIIPSGSIPAYNPAITKLLNLDFGGSPQESKVGLAAVGISADDYWNQYAQAYAYVGSVTNLKWSDSSIRTAGFVIRNAPGSWSISLPDLMLRTYLYAYSSGNITLTLTNLPDGNCDIYCYGHSAYTNDNAIFEIWSDEISQGTKGTSINGYGFTSNKWEIGQQYVLFKDVAVFSNQPVIIQAKHGNFGYNNLAGVQIAYKGAVDSDADGLPDGWEMKWFGNLNQTAGGDPDADVLSNFREYQLSLEPYRYDSDADGVADWQDNEFPVMEDATPQGGVQFTAGGDNWNWVSSWSDGIGWEGSTIAPHSGVAMRVSANTTNTIHQHYFERAVAVMRPATGDVLYAYVNLDPSKPPGEVMLQFHVMESNGYYGREHRAYWGANNITYGTDGTVSRTNMGALPPPGQWVRLEVPVSAVGLEGKIIEGINFTLYGGRAAWDNAGIFNPDMDGDGWLDSIEIQYFGDLSQSPTGDYDEDGLPNGVDADAVTADTEPPVFQIVSPAEGSVL